MSDGKPKGLRLTHRDTWTKKELTASNTAPSCPPERPPTNTATQRPKPSPSGSLHCKPKAGPAKLGRVSGGQWTLFGFCLAPSVRS